MSEYKYEFNKRTGKFDLVPSNTVITYKSGVVNAAALPTEGNELNDGRITADDQHLHIWDGSAWQDQGDIIDLYWSALIGKPISSVENIDDAVDKKHTQDTDTILKYLPESLDQSQTDIDAYRNTTANFILAQTFVAGGSGNLSKVTLQLKKRGNPGEKRYPI